MHLTTLASRLLVAGFFLSAVHATADVVEATIQVSADDFVDSALQPPQGATSSSIDAIFTITFNSAITAQENLTLDAISGLDIVANDGSVMSYDLQSAGFNSRRFAADDKVQITLGGFISQVEFMAGLSNDFRVVFDLSLEDYSVLGVIREFSFVTPADPFYDARDTTVTMLDLNIMPDSDADTLIDDVDNCIEASNLDQRDTDGDGIGNRCDADFNQDCIINIVDLGVLRQDFFATGDLDTDLDGDGGVNVTDLGIMRSLFFQAPGPSGVSTLCSP